MIFRALALVSVNLSPAIPAVAFFEGVGLKPVNRQPPTASGRPAREVGLSGWSEGAALAGLESPWVRLAVFFLRGHFWRRDGEAPPLRQSGIRPNMALESRGRGFKRLSPLPANGILRGALRIIAPPGRQGRSAPIFTRGAAAPGRSER